MMKLNPQKKKYHKFYMSLAEMAAKQSVAVRRKVGAVLVLPTGLISTGWNGMPAGMDNCCEYYCEKTNHKHLPNLETKPEVVHAEMNALDKLTQQGISAEGAILFVTTVPCINCAEELLKTGIKAVYYKDVQASSAGPDKLNDNGVPTFKY